MKKTVFLALAVLFTVTWSCHTAFGQPPPLGPPNYRTDSPGISVSLLTNFATTTVQGIVDDTNNKLKQRGSGDRLQLLTPLTTHLPYRKATQFTDRPNQWYVDVLVDVTIEVSIPHAPNAQIFLSLDINVSCDGWQTGKGTVLIVSNPSPLNVEGANIGGVDIPFVTDYILGQIRQQFPSLKPVSMSYPNSPCATIGAQISSDHSATNSAILFDPPPPPRRIPDPVVSRLSSNLVVTFLRLKRLAARGNGEIVYSPTESIMLSTYTNFDYRQVNLTMKEGDDIALTLAPVTLKPLLDSLVVIANIAQGPTQQPEDSSWDTALASANFSPGVHTITINKHYIVPPGRGNPKPLQVPVAGYELTYSVSYTKPTTDRASAP